MQSSNVPSLFNSTWSFQDQHSQDHYSPPTEEFSNLSLSEIRLARSARGAHAYRSLKALDVTQNIGPLDVALTPGSYPSTPYVHLRATLPTSAFDNNSISSPTLIFHHMHPPTPHIPPSATLSAPSADECSMPLTQPPQIAGNSLGVHRMHAATSGTMLPTSLSTLPSTPEPGPQAGIAPDSIAKAQKVRRPPNPFMFFRSHLYRSHLEKLSNKDPKAKKGQQQVFSRVAGEAWNRTTLEERQPFIELAKEAQKTHRRDHPDYKYSPQRKRSRMKGHSRRDLESGADDTAPISKFVFVENVLDLQGKAIQEKPSRRRGKGRAQRFGAPSTSRIHPALSQPAIAPASPATGYRTHELGPMQTPSFVYVPQQFCGHSEGLADAPHQHIPLLDTGINMAAPSLSSITQPSPADDNTTQIGLTPAPVFPFSTLSHTSQNAFGFARATRTDNATSLTVTAPASPISYHSAELGPASAPFISSSTMPHMSLDSFGYPADLSLLIAPRRPSSSLGFFRDLERGKIISRPASTVPAVSHPATDHHYVMHPYTSSLIDHYANSLAEDVSPSPV
ncbi:uncharacterized protein BT62DRAFT_676271 [Guyanagaster necrorhizus]|uniref:HMG box domain-containing protein n=1 Tax=Guyanagaster necrorhizus TaxID=856835 RepID=A0A9P7VZ89_9AGAR|nr:uncharacterized protein BT62DRAFT_676271 [Guyanagaster necrorhizus MCA 3950]KAG7449303.1 hypothetical protein BT62DRAFT_676271 [Guyanagaster necrorhizus MCA 3950]